MGFFSSAWSVLVHSMRRKCSLDVRWRATCSYMNILISAKRIWKGKSIWCQFIETYVYFVDDIEFYPQYLLCCNIFFRFLSHIITFIGGGGRLCHSCQVWMYVLFFCSDVIYIYFMIGKTAPVATLESCWWRAPKSVKVSGFKCSCFFLLFRNIIFK